MKRLQIITLLFLAFSSAVLSQVTNEIILYARPGTDLKVVGDFANSATGNFTIDVNAVLDIDGDLNNNGTMTFENDASLMRGSNSVDGGSGIYNVKRQGSTGNRYNHWGSPVGQSGAVPGNPSYSYNEANSTQWDGDDADPDPGWAAFSGNMSPGDGYTGMGAGLVTFSDDAVNNGTLTTPLHTATYDPTYTSTTGGSPFNLVGNPYPSALDAWSLVNDASNSNIHGSLYFWDDDGSGGSGYTYNDYAVWNASGGLPAVTSSGGGGNTPNGTIPTGQGFMVRNATAGQLTFNNGMRVANNSSNHFFRLDGEVSRLWFSINDGENYNQILVALLDDATNEEDRLYDAVKASANQSLSIAAKNADTDYAILAFPPPGIDQTVPLSINVSTSGEHVFKADIMEGFDEFNVYFNDAELNTNVLLNEGTSASVSLLAGEYYNRFFLNYVRTSFTGITEEATTVLTAYAANGMLHVILNGVDETATIELLDMSGRVVLAESDPRFTNGNATISLQGLRKGVYVVRVAAEAQTLSQKILKL